MARGGEGAFAAAALAVGDDDGSANDDAGDDDMKVLPCRYVVSRV